MWIWLIMQLTSAVPQDLNIRLGEKSSPSIIETYLITTIYDLHRQNTKLSVLPPFNHIFDSHYIYSSNVTWTLVPE